MSSRTLTEERPWDGHRGTGLDEAEQARLNRTLAGDGQAAPAGLAAIWDDFIMHCPERGQRSGFRQALVILMYLVGSPGFHLCLLHRLGAFCHRRGLALPALAFEKFIYHWYHCIVPSSLRAGKGLWFPHPLSIVIADNVRLGDAVTIYQGVQLVNGGQRKSQVTIGDGTLLGADAMVLGRRVGPLSVVGARAVVVRDLAAGHVAMGHPATAEPASPLVLRDRIHVLHDRVVW